MLMLQVVLPYALRLGFEAVITSDVQGRVACKGPALWTYGLNLLILVDLGVTSPGHTFAYVDLLR